MRPRRADQRGDYDEAFLDWFFWWYLATLDLTDQLLAGQGAAQPAGPRPETFTGDSAQVRAGHR